MENDKELLVIIINEFFADTSERMQLLNQAFANNNKEEIIIHSHSMKSTGALLQLKKFQEISYNIEIRGKEGDIKKAEGLLPSLEVEFQRAKSILNNALLKLA